MVHIVELNTLIEHIQFFCCQYLPLPVAIAWEEIKINKTDNFSIAKSDLIWLTLLFQGCFVSKSKTMILDLLRINEEGHTFALLNLTEGLIYCISPTVYKSTQQTLPSFLCFSIDLIPSAEVPLPFVLSRASAATEWKACILAASSPFFVPLSPLNQNKPKKAVLTTNDCTQNGHTNTPVYQRKKYKSSHRAQT